MDSLRWWALLVVGAALLGLTGCNVGGPSGGGGTVSVTKAASASWVAAQDGSGAWQALSGDSFTVSDGAGKYGVAWACPASGGAPVLVFTVQSTVSESASVTTFCPSGVVVVSPPYTVSGTVSAIPSGFTADITLSSSNGMTVSTGGVSSPGGTYSLSAAAGTHALLAYDVDGSNNPGNMVLTRSVSVSGDVSNLNVDMSSGQAFSMGTANLAGAASGASTTVSAGFGVSGEGSASLAGLGNSSLSYPMVPAALMQSGDLYGFYGDAGTSSTEQTVLLATSSPAPVITLQLPAVVPSDAGFQVSGSTGTANWGSLSFAAGGATTYLAGLTPNSGAAWVALVTPGWLGSATSYTFPNFTATSGWNSAWDFVTNQSAYVALGGTHGNVTFAQLNQVIASESGAGPGGGSLPDGATVSTTTRSFTGTY